MKKDTYNEYKESIFMCDIDILKNSIEVMETFLGDNYSGIALIEARKQIDKKDIEDYYDTFCNSDSLEGINSYFKKYIDNKIKRINYN